jgi:hypothetical protein
MHAPQDDRDAAVAEGIGDVVTAKRCARHEGDPDKVRFDAIEVDFLHVLVEDAHVETIVGMSGKDGQVQLGNGGLRPPPGDETILVGRRMDQD